MCVSIKIQRMALEISVWPYDEAPRLSAHQAQPICEALIPIQSARERNTDFWPLRAPLASPQSRRKSLNDLMGKNLMVTNASLHSISTLFHHPLTSFTV